MNNGNIEVLEIRNYLLKSNEVDAFGIYFNNHFVKSMATHGGRTLGRFKLLGDGDRFVWMRGFADMKVRSRFLPAFYHGPVWKEFGAAANAMMINSDNVYLLRPLKAGTIDGGKFVGRFVIVDFYVCNGTLKKTIELFEREYLPFMQSSGINDISLWVSEMAENDFPALPAFQDENLLVGITVFNDEADYKAASKPIQSLDSEIKYKMLELITTRSSLILYPFSEFADQK